MNTLEYIPSMIAISIEDANTGLGNATDNESLDSQYQSPYHQNEEDKEDAEEVTTSDLQALQAPSYETKIKGIYYSPQLFYKHSPEYLKSHRLAAMTAVSSFYSEPSRSSTTAGTCSDDPATTTSAQDCIATSDDNENKLKATRRDVDVSRNSNNKKRLQRRPIRSSNKASHVPLPPRRKNGSRRVISPDIMSNLSPLPFHADGEERIMTKCPPSPRKASLVFFC